MPGMGIGVSLPRAMVFKRRFRWVFYIRQEGDGFQIEIPPVFVRIAARPNISFEELELNYLNERAWISGKPTFEPINVTFLDAKDTSGSVDSGQIISDWVQSVYQYGRPESSGQMSDPGRFYKCDGAHLIMYDGVGNELENWHFFGLWPQSVNYGEVDYTNNDTADIEVTFRFDNVERKFSSSTGGKAGPSTNS